MKLDRIIFASDLNANYIQFWPLVSRVWQMVTGARPTLFFVAPVDTPVEAVPDTDIIYVPPPVDLPTCFIAQTIRLLGPTWFPDEVCVVSDIDLMVVNRQFFPRHLQGQTPDTLVVLNRYPREVGHASLSYHVGTGHVFARLFRVEPGVKDPESLYPLLRQWYQKGQGQWSSDEWTVREHRRQYAGKVAEIFTPHLWRQPICSVTHYSGFRFLPERKAQYIEVEPPYPYLAHRSRIHQVLHQLLPDLSLESIEIRQAGVVKANRHPHKPPQGQALTVPVRRRLGLKRPGQSRPVRPRPKITSTRPRLV